MEREAVSGHSRLLWSPSRWGLLVPTVTDSGNCGCCSVFDTLGALSYLLCCLSAASHSVTSTDSFYWQEQLECPEHPAN